MLKAAAQFVVDAIKEELGHPSSLVKLITKEPGLNKPLVEYDKGISSDEVVKWHEFGNLSYERSRPCKGSLNGFGHCPGANRNYGGVSVRREDLLNLGTTREVERWECDIQDVDGFSASKSELHLFKSMDAMVGRVYAAASLVEMLQRTGSAFFTVIVMRGIRANPTIDLTKMCAAVPAKIIRIRDP